MTQNKANTQGVESRNMENKCKVSPEGQYDSGTLLSYKESLELQLMI